jgi:hypothetical protein
MELPLLKHLFQIYSPIATIHFGVCEFPRTKLLNHHAQNQSRLETPFTPMLEETLKLKQHSKLYQTQALKLDLGSHWCTTAIKEKE